MKGYNKVKKMLFPYLYDALNDKESVQVKSILEKDKSCYKEYKKWEKVQSVVDATPSISAPDQYDYILQKAKGIEQKSDLSQKKFYFCFVSNFIKKIRQKMIFRIGFGIIVLALFSILFLRPKSCNYLYIVKASGDVIINHESFFKKCRFKYSLNKKTEIQVMDGECVLQINNDKLVLLKNNTLASIKGERDIKISLDKGTLIGKVVKNMKKKLIISMKGSVFEIVGTVFKAKYSKGLKAFEVKKGIVKSTDNNKDYYLKQGEKVTIKNNKLFFTTLKSSEYNSDIWNQINNIEINQRLKNMQKVVLKASPLASEVFWKKKKMGKLPLFLWNKKGMYKRLMITHKGCVSKEIDISKKRRYNLDVVLKKKISPEIMWEFKLKNKVYSSPFYIRDNIIITDNKGRIYKIDPYRKEVIWEFETGKRNNSLPIYYKGTLYISDGYLYAIDFKKGKLKWKAQIDTLVYSSAQLYEDKLYTCNSEGYLFCINKEDGIILWKKRLDKGFFSSPVIYNDNLYVGGLSGNFYSINLKTKKVDWTFQTGNRIIGSKPVIKNNVIFFGSNDGNLYAINLNGKLKWKYKTKGAIFTSPIIIEDSIIIASVNGSIFSIWRKDGTLDWEFNTGNKILLTPHWINEKYLYVGTDKDIYVFNRWGKLFTQFKHSLTGFVVLKSRDILLSGKDKHLYNFQFKLD